MNVLLSIRPEFADAIWSGTKRYEFRRRIFDTFLYQVVYVYTTAPISRVTGVFFVEDVIIGTPEQVWNKTSNWAGIEERRFLSYFEGARLAFALKIGAARRFEQSLELTSHFGLQRPPQSYAFVDRVAEGLTYEPN